MFRSKMLCLMLCASLIIGAAVAAGAVEVDCDDTYCFSAADFASTEQLEGICITGLPDCNTGTVLLGSRVLQPGDILTAEQVAQMTFVPLLTETDAQAQVTYLPIYADRVDRATTMTISIRGKVDQPPVAEDSRLETYKNLPNEGLLNVSDPEGDPLTFTLTRAPRRGEVILRSDGTRVLKAEYRGRQLLAYPSPPMAVPPAGLPGNARYLTARSGRGYWVMEE